MVRTKSEVKLKISEWIEKRKEDFSTEEVKQDISKIATNIHLSPNRLTKFIAATGKADFDKAKKLWSVRIRV
jgi:hypothetical protein